MAGAARAYPPPTHPAGYPVRLTASLHTPFATRRPTLTTPREPSRCSGSVCTRSECKKGRARLPGARPCRMTSNRRVRYSAAGAGGIS